MKRFLLFLVPVLFVTVVLPAQQAPWLVIDNYTNSSSTVQKQSYNDVFGPSDEQHPVRINNTAQEEHLAGNRIVLRPGFQAANFSGNGNYRAHIGAAPEFEVVFIEPNAHYPLVPRFEKLELGVKLPVVIEQQINSYLAGNGGINPYAPDEIRMEATFYNANTTLRNYGFYYRDYVRDQAAMVLNAPAKWIEQPTDYHFRIRFAPNYTGEWYCNIAIYLNGNVVPDYQASHIAFYCVPSAKKGYLQLGADSMHLKTSGDNKSFFAIGQNIAWPDDSIFIGGPTIFPQLYRTGIMDLYQFYNTAADNGANFIRFVTTPDMGQFEWRKLGDYDNRQAQAWELDQLFKLCDARDIYMMFNLDFQGEFQRENGVKGWEHNPYSQIPGIVDPVDMFQSGGQAQADVQYYLRRHIYYFLARWGYSTSLGVIQMYSENDNWNGMEDLMDIDGAGNPTAEGNWFDFLRFYALELKSYNMGNMHLLTTSIAKVPWDYRYASYHIYDIPQMDVTTTNIYLNDRRATKEYYQRVKGLRNHWDKPTIISEMGLFHVRDTTNHIPIADPNDITACSDIAFHNYMWGTALNGSFGTGLNWWQWFNEPYRPANFPAIRAFFDDIDFNGLSFLNDPGRWDDGSVGLSWSGVHETVYLKRNNNKGAIGWAHNLTYWWGNIDESCTDRNGFKMPIPNDLDDDTQYSDPQNIIPFTTGMKIEGFNLGFYYIKWYDTRNQGGHINAYDEVLSTDIFGRLNADWPGGADLAFIVEKINVLSPGNQNLPTDTLLCSEDTLFPQLTYKTDSTGMWNYVWDVNGTIYNQWHPNILLPQAGDYNITLTITDTSGNTDTLRQLFVKPACDTLINRSTVYNNTSTENRMDELKIFPNPNNGIFMVQLPHEPIQCLSVYNTLGELVEQTANIVGKTETLLDLSHIPAGFYLLNAFGNNKIYACRFVIQR